MTPMPSASASPLCRVAGGFCSTEGPTPSQLADSEEILCSGVAMLPGDSPKDRSHQRQARNFGRLRSLRTAGIAIGASRHAVTQAREVVRGRLAKRAFEILHKQLRLLDSPDIHPISAGGKLRSEPARCDIPFALFADLATVIRCFEERFALETRTRAGAEAA